MQLMGVDGAGHVRLAALTLGHVVEMLEAWLAAGWFCMSRRVRET